MTRPYPPLIAAMLQADFYPHPTHNIHLLQTHISWVILTGEFVYKVKKPVNFGFVDFSTLEKRKHYCEEELRLNRRLAADLYLDVLPIGCRVGRFQLCGNTDVFEWCVKMRQFTEGDLLVDRIKDGDFDAAWMDALAADMAAFHAKAEHSPEIATFGAPSYLLSHIDASLNAALRHPETIKPDLIHNLRRQCMHETKFLAHAFETRIAEHRIRDCHGDLHLGNIALFKDRPTVFDCIEFNPEYRAIDTLNDAAFLVMDCEARGHPDLAFRFLSRYLEFSGDYSGLDLLALFLSYRAGVRGKVACLLSEDACIEKSEKQTHLKQAAHYFEMASDYLSPKAPPHLLAVGGLSGSGKSHLCLLGCGVERAVIIRSDATRKRIADSYPELELYSDTMSRHTYQAMFDAAKSILQAGWPVILDATFLSTYERRRARDVAASEDVPFHLFWLDVPDEQMRRNILRRQTVGTDLSDADIAVLEGQLAGYARPAGDNIKFLISSDVWPIP